LRRVSQIDKTQNQSLDSPFFSPNTRLLRST